jgi:hypothetical protein
MSRSLRKFRNITQEGEIIKNLNKGEFYKYLGINQSNHIQHSIIKENLEKQFYLRIKSLLKSKLNGNNLIKAVNTYAVPLLTYFFGVVKWSKTNLQNINIKTRFPFTKFSKHHHKSSIQKFNLPRENGGRGFSNLEILQHNQIVSLKKLFPFYMGDILKNWNNQKLIFRLLRHGLRNQIFTLRRRVLYLQFKIVL